METTEKIGIEPRMYDVIKSCSNRASLDTFFTKFAKFSKEQSIKVLLDIMENPAVSYLGGYPEIDERYEVVAGAFLSGIWRRDYLSFKAEGKFNDI